jgi:hypothetical protein
MSVETNSPPEQGPSPWAIKQLRNFAEIASQIPPGGTHRFWAFDRRVRIRSRGAGRALVEAAERFIYGGH